MNRRRGGSLASSPLLIGAVTTLIVVVAVYISYNANNGLPFVPTYHIKVVLPQTSGLQASNEVRIAGTRVGIVEGQKPVVNPKTGQVTAVSTLKLEKKVEPLPADTTASVQSVSTIGLKYLSLEEGHSRRTIPPGGVIPSSQVTEPVNIEELFNMFDAKTSAAIQVNTNAYGAGLAGRGLGLNNTIATLRPLVTNAIPVLHNLASPKTDLRGLFKGLDRAAEETAPVAAANARWYQDLDTFFRAWASVAPSLEAATVGGPPSLEQAIHSLNFEASNQEKSAEFMHLLQPSAKLLISVAPPLGHAVTVGAVNLKAATALNEQLASSAEALKNFGENPVVTLGLENFTQTLQFGNPLLAGLAPEQATCNYFTLAFRNLASLTSENIGIGTLSRAALVLSPNGFNNEGYPSTAPANGPSIEHRFGSSAIVDNNHLHANPYPNVTGPGQPKGNCEAGNESYLAGKAVIGNVPGTTGATHEVTTREQNLFSEKYPAATLEDLGLGKKTSTATKSTAKASETSR
jgi:ABC-type transporter Mla subunit MlaD